MVPTSPSSPSWLVIRRSFESMRERHLRKVKIISPHTRPTRYIMTSSPKCQKKEEPGSKKKDMDGNARGARERKITKLGDTEVSEYLWLEHLLPIRSTSPSYSFVELSI
jgi:hypothetical protein